MFKSLEKFNLLNPSFLGVLAGFGIALTIFSGELFFLMVMLLFFIAVLRFTGNIFVLNSTINLKKVFGSLVLFVVIFLLEEYFKLQDVMSILNVSLVSLISISFIFYIFFFKSISKSIKLIWENFTDILKSFKNHLFQFRIAPFLGIIMELILIYFIWDHNSSSNLVFPMIFFWAISGFIYVLVLFTDFVLEENLEKVISILKVYGATRLTYFLVPFFIAQPLMHWLLFSFIFILVYVGLIWGLQPYILGNEDLRNALRILRLLKDKRELKITKISEPLELSKEKTENLLQRLSVKRMVKRNPNKKWQLGELYSLVTKL